MNTTITCWQVFIEGVGWKMTSPSIAARASSLHQAKGGVRLADQVVSLRPKFEPLARTISVRGVTPRRLVAATKALKSQRDRAPLFADKIAEAQPSPEQRISGFDEGVVDLHRERRAFEGRQRRLVYRRLRSLPIKQQAHVLARFGTWFGPRDAGSLRYLLENSQ